MAAIRLPWHLPPFQNPFFILKIISLASPASPLSLNPSILAGTTAGKPSSVPRRRGTAGAGTTAAPPPAAAVRAGAPRAGGAAGAATTAVDTRPRGTGRGRGAGAGPLHPVGSGNATTPIRRTERELVWLFWFRFVGFFFPGKVHIGYIFFKIIKLKKSVALRLLGLNLAKGIRIGGLRPVV